MTMNMDLAAMYGTPGGPSEEDQEKVAQMELFTKLAAETGIDLNQYTDEEIDQLWNETFKGASDESEKKDEKPKKEEGEEDEEKEVAAQAEFAEAQEWQEKVAEMDYLGRLMAHAYVNELNEIGESMNKEAIRRYTGPGAARQTANKVLEKIRGGAKVPESLKERMGRFAERVGTKEIGGSRRSGGVMLTPPEEARAAGRKTLKRVGMGAGVAGAGAIGAGGYAASKKKQSSAIDEYALELALQKVAEANWDVEQAAERLNALYTLDAVPESEKIAAASDINEAVEARSLELLEAAGYPVEWNNQ